MSDDTAHLTDQEGALSAGPASRQGGNRSNVVDLGGARTTRKTKMQKLVEIFRAFPLDVTRTTSNPSIH